jgi:hypothetical protein
MCPRELWKAFDGAPEERTEFAAAILRNAADLIAAPAAWTTNTTTAARDVEGNEVNCVSDEAESFCALGAVQRATRDLGDVRFGRPFPVDVWPTCGLAWRVVRDCLGGVDPQVFNNTVADTAEDVIDALLIAAEVLEAGELSDSVLDPWGAAAGGSTLKASRYESVPAAGSADAILLPSTVAGPRPRKRAKARPRLTQLQRELTERVAA